MISTIIFCQNPLNKNEVDPDFEIEFAAAKESGFDTLLFDFETLTNEEELFNLSKIKTALQPTDVIYRGWMLTPNQYALLYKKLLDKNYILLNSPTEYRNCHYLPDSLRFIENYTPKTVYEYLTEKEHIDTLIQKAKVFNNAPVILKDFVKSEKHNWEEACFVQDASDEKELTQKIKRLIELRGKFLNEGIVIREFIQFNSLTNHSKSGMPLTEEYRLFFYRNKLIGKYNYWEEGDYTNKAINTAEFEKIALKIESNFFSMDIARKANGDMVIIELGDGQVAGLPDTADPLIFFSKLRT